MKIYSLNANGRADELIASAPVNADGTYAISDLDPKRVNLSARALQATNYLLEYECGDTNLQRFVTGTTAQNLNEATTLLSWINQTENNEVVVQQAASNWDFFYQALEGATTLAEAYTILTSLNPSLEARFESTFGFPASDLLLASPRIRSTTAPLTLAEGQISIYSVQSYHWSAFYTSAYLWRIGTQVLSEADEFTFEPTKNQQGKYRLELLIGVDDGTGSVDLSKPYTEEFFDIQITDSFPAVVPDIIRTSSEYTNTLTVNLEINSGAIVDGIPENCSTFSRLAIIEDDTPPNRNAPRDDASYTIDCTQSPTQAISFTLSGIQGRRTLRVWAMDSSGNISSTSKDIEVVQDAVAPQITFSGIRSGDSIRGGDTRTISWGISESHPAASPLRLDFSSDNGSTWSTLMTATSASDQYSWTLPVINTSSARIRIVATDLAGNVATTISPVFSIDSTPPSAPTVARSSASPSASTTVSISTLCSSDFGSVLYSESSTTPLGTDPNWRACAASTTFTVSSGNGVKTIYAWSRDRAGNISATASTISMTLSQP